MYKTAVTKICVAFLFFIAIGGVAETSNNDIYFRHISLEQGLSQTYVYCIFEDSKGFMWFGTQDGLNKFDGYDFKIYRPETGNPNSISHNQIFSIHEDKEGIMWIATNGGGLNRFDRVTGTFTSFLPDPRDKHSISAFQLRTIHEDRQGILWIASQRGLNRFDKKTGGFTVFRSDPDDPSTLSYDEVADVCEDDTGTLWLATRRGLNRFDRASGQFVRYFPNPTLPGVHPENNIRRLLVDHSGTLWVGTNVGLLLFDPGSGMFIRYPLFPEEFYFSPGNIVVSLFEDYAGVLWVGTPRGLHQFDRRSETFVHYHADPLNPGSLSHNIVSSMAGSRSGTLWVGTAGGGINKFDREGPRFRTYRNLNQLPGGLSSNDIFAIHQDSTGTLWLGSRGAGLDRVERKDRTIEVKNFRHNPLDSRSLSSNSVRTICEDNEGNLWLGTDSGLNRFEPSSRTFRRYGRSPLGSNSLSDSAIQVLKKNRRGGLWVGTSSGGVNRYHPRTGKFTRFISEPSNPDSLSSNFVNSLLESKSGTLWVGTAGAGLNALDPETGKVTRYFYGNNSQYSTGTLTIQEIHEDKQGILWLGTFGGGIYRFNPQTGSLKQYTQKDGLANNVVYCIMEDVKGYLWLSTNMGIARFNPKTENFSNYNARDGLQSNEFNGGAAFKSVSGEMFFGGVNGFNSFFPDRVRDNPFVPPVVITEFRIFNQPVKPGLASVLDKHIAETGEIVLSHSHNVFSFEFVALDYTIPEKNRYAYMLEGFDKDWNYTSYKKRHATYTNLDPGQYEFRVKGSNNDGVWNTTGASVKINVKPPLTRTWWFRILAGLAAVGLAVFAYKRRTRELSQQTRLKTELQTARDAQMSIMPQSDPDVQGYDISGLCVPASEVGGDFFDYLWLDENKNRFGIAIGDVSGKSMKAAMTAVMSDGILFSKASETDSIKEIMTRVNKPLYFKTDKRMFTALCLVSLNINTRELIFTNAGLNHPMLKSNGDVSIIKGEGPQFPLGIKKDNQYREKTSILNPGDVLVLFTDGIPEAQDNACRFYEYHRMETLLKSIDTASLSASQIKLEIIDDALAFCGSAPQNDDMTVVVIKVLNS